MTAKLVIGMLLAMVLTAIPSLSAENVSTEMNTSDMLNATDMNNLTNETTWFNFTSDLATIEPVRPRVLALGSISQDPQSTNDPSVFKTSGMDEKVFEDEFFRKIPGGIASEFGTDEQIRFLNS